MVHSFYRSDVPSGENVVVMRQAEALRDAGHEVEVVARHTDDEMHSRLHGVRSAFRVATGVGTDPTDELRAFRPDVVHVHNLFPNFGERWLDAWDGPLVATLHNFRPICANALLFREGQVCTKCPDGDRWSSLKYACYRDSRLATLPLAIHNAGGVRWNRLLRRADRIVVLSGRAREAYARAGLGTHRMNVIANGLEDLDGGTEPSIDSRGWAFVGRLTPEKGILELLRSWPPTEQLDVIGDGPLAGRASALTPQLPHVNMLGLLASARVDERLRTYEGLLIPSGCFEGFPTVITEALRAGTPVIARAGNSAADFISEQERNGAIGAVYGEGGVSLESAMRTVREDLNMPARCRATFETELSEAAWVRRLEAIYQEVLIHGNRAQTIMPPAAPED